jgi:hypothetical protein
VGQREQSVGRIEADGASVRRIPVWKLGKLKVYLHGKLFLCRTTPSSVVRHQILLILSVSEGVVQRRKVSYNVGRCHTTSEGFVRCRKVSHDTKNICHVNTPLVANRISWLMTGWPDCANFRLLDDSLLWAVFLKMTEVSQIFGQRFPRKTLCVNFAIKIGWATYILHDFSQIHLVTLVREKINVQ